MLGLKEDFLQAFRRKTWRTFLNPCSVNAGGQKRAAVLLIHSYVAFDLLHVWQGKQNRENAARATCHRHRREYWRFDDAIMQRLPDVKAELVFSASMKLWPGESWQLRFGLLLLNPPPPPPPPSPLMYTTACSCCPAPSINHLLAACAHLIHLYIL